MSSSGETTTQYRTLSAIVDNVDQLKAVYKSDLEFGDQLVVTTRNSNYFIHAFEGDLYSITGGWFDLHGLSPINIGINGCTWGGRAIKQDLLAACGLHLEFGNNVVTSRILRFQIIRDQKKSIH